MPTIFVKTLISVATFAFFLIAGAEANEPPIRPNILFIMSDDHAFQAIGAYGSNRNETHHIDRLAHEGMRFDRCVVTNSICGPCRAVIQTGKYSHKNGFMTNGDRFDIDQTTFPKILQQCGYQTAIVGKWHLACGVKGYDYSEVLIGQGPYYNPEMIRNGQKIKYEGYTTEIITDLTLKWLKEERDSNKPFMLMCQHKAPHREWDPTPKYYQRYQNTLFEEPATLFDDYRNRGRALLEQNLTIEDTMDERDCKVTGPPSALTESQKADWHTMYDSRVEEYKKLKNSVHPVSEESLVRWKYQCYMRDYMSCVAAVDDSVGEILSYLDESGLSENTIVLYTSDQGFFLGEHGLFDKRYMYEESFKTPLIVRWPGVVAQKTVNSDIVSNLDFAQTFLDAAGTDIPNDMQGRSLLPLLRGKTPDDWRKSIYYHYYEYPGWGVKKHEGVFDGRFKLIHFYDDIDEWELYDLENDPQEMNNIHANPCFKDQVDRLYEELERIRIEVDCPKPVPNTKSRIYSNPPMPESLEMRPIIEKRKSRQKRAERPNFLMISCEDVSPWLGYNGESYATTPRIDELAQQGIAFHNTFATAPVCSPCRFAIMTGRYATSYGTQRLRSAIAVPPTVEGYPTSLRRAGYYCTNNSKTDYNTKDEHRMIADSWDECGPKAHWRSRKPGQPFFAVFNLMETHQGEMFKETPLDRTFRHDPEKAPVPPYLPDTQEARRTMARIHDCMTEMDEHLGKILDELKEEGLERETIVFFWSDHGQGIPRGKRTLWDTGLKVPMIVRFPSKFQSLAPEKSGATSDRLIMLMDLGPTLLSLAGLSVPSGLHGQAFLGKEAGEPRKYVYGARDRVDEVLELSRSVRDENYLYIKNYMPHLSWMQPEGYSDQLPLRREIATLAVEGKLNVNQLTFAGPRKPLEELYDTKNDPWQLNNLATIPAMQPILEKMRQELRRWQLDTRDSGFLHEWQAAKLCENGKSLHEIIASDKHYPLERLCNIADNVGRLGQAAYFAKLLDDSDHTVRYWAMVGLKASGQDAAEFKEQIIHAMNDESMPIQIEAAGIMVDLFGDSRAYELLGRTLEGTEIHAVVHASRTIELLGEKARPLIPVIHRVLAKKPSMPVVFSLKETLRFFK